MSKGESEGATEEEEREIESWKKSLVIKKSRGIQRGISLDSFIDLENPEIMK